MCAIMITGLMDLDSLTHRFSIELHHKYAATWWKSEWVKPKNENFHLSLQCKPRLAYTIYIYIYIIPYFILQINANETIFDQIKMNSKKWKWKKRSSNWNWFRFFDINHHTHMTINNLIFFPTKKNEKFRKMKWNYFSSCLHCEKGSLSF